MSQAERIILKFGGIRPAASMLDLPASTVQGWKERGWIPAQQQPLVLATARRHRIALDPSEFVVDPRRARTARA